MGRYGLKLGEIGNAGMRHPRTATCRRASSGLEGPQEIKDILLFLRTQ